MTKTEYYALKGMVSEMTPEQQAQVEEARQATIELMKSSEVATIGVTMAVLQLNEALDIAGRSNGKAQDSSEPSGYPED
jgi:hypothetical protein